MTEQQPQPDYDAERDMWGSWWLAHIEIDKRVKAGEMELPEIFVPTRREREG
jgi:hypothetical protein